MTAPDITEPMKTRTPEKNDESKTNPVEQAVFQADLDVYVAKYKVFRKKQLAWEKTAQQGCLT